jgi:hypothetical protein
VREGEGEGEGEGERNGKGLPEGEPVVEGEEEAEGERAALALRAQARLGHEAQRAAAAGDRPQHRATAVRADMVACPVAAGVEEGPAVRPQPLAEAATAVAAKSGSWR